MMPSKFQKGARPKPTVTVAEFRLGAKPKADDQPDETDEEETPVSAEAELAAVKSLRKALATQDDEKAARALKDFLAACGAYDGDDDQGDETEGDE